MNPLHLDGLTYDEETVGSLIEEVIKIRDEALCQNCFGPSVTLSHAVACLNHLKAELARDNGEKTEVYLALEASLKLQSHYAKLLNMHDGGKRRGFASVDAWLNRLREIAQTRSE